MPDEDPNTERNISLQQLFKIYLKTGRKRVAFSIISGIIIFLAISGLVMVFYTYRFKTFQTYQEENGNWYNDGVISVSSQKAHAGPFNTSFFPFDSEVIQNVSQDFRQIINDRYPDIEILNYSYGVSVLMYEYNLILNPIEGYILHDLMTVDDAIYNNLDNYLVAGRMPQNSSEILCYKRDYQHNATLNSIEYIRPILGPGPSYNYSVVGVVDNLDQMHENNSYSSDLFHWDISSFELNFDTYNRYNTYIMNMTTFVETVIGFHDYSGLLTFLLDANFECSALRLNAMSKYIDLIPPINDPLESDALNHHIMFCPDLEVFFEEFGLYWVQETAQVLSINAPLFFMIGLLVTVTLNIGSKDVGLAFRRMKLYGLSYPSIRKMIFLENTLITLATFIVGGGVGLGLNYAFTANIADRPENFFANFLIEPLFLLFMGVFMLALFSLSFFIQNSIAKKTAGLEHEEYKQKRAKITQIFSTNEFRLFVVGLIFTIISLVLFLIYNFADAETNLQSNVNYLTLLWFLISCSAAFIMTFIFLLIARMINLFWGFISDAVWPKMVNMFSLSLHHMTVNRGIYQVTIMGALIFGLVILPGFGINSSIQTNLKGEANHAIAGSDLAILSWVDPNNEKDALLQNISNVDSFAEATIFRVEKENEYVIHLLGIEDPSSFLSVIDTGILEGKKVTPEDIQALEAGNNFLANQKFARRNHLQPGDLYDTSDYALYPDNITFVDSYDHFPMTPIAKKPLFSSIDVFSFVGKKSFIGDFVNSLGFDTFVDVKTIKLIKTTDQSAIPQIKEQLQEYGLVGVTPEDYFEDLYSEIEIFTRYNLLLFGIIASFSLLYIGYFTGQKIYEERVRIIESLYRVGAERGQIIGLFTFEMILTNLLPILVTVFSSLPLLEIISTNTLGAEEVYYPFKPGIPIWVYFVVTLGGLVLAIGGWLLSLMPSVYRYRPIKQE
ncbi:MAG: hypothetical protein GF308_21560 [Candidatus Heimdallarchaeota archaeon]|nr:hypothetical protein [Candidatus Heimdallarchaeota archaeon]